VRPPVLPHRSVNLNICSGAFRNAFVAPLVGD